MHETVCDLLLDLVQNSIEAKSSLIELRFDEDEESVRVCLSDNGCGMNQEELERAKDPFHTDGKKHRHRKVGLGLPFLIQTIQQLEGELEIESKPGEGTEISFALPKRHLDMPPIGSIPAFLLPAFSWNSEYEMVFTRSWVAGDVQESYRLQRSELLDALGDLTSADTLSLLRTFLISQEEEIQAAL